ncbi:MAG: hypothetical protein ACI92C_002475 [Neolewinella sp.]|jgi:hypothetical protein
MIDGLVGVRHVLHFLIFAVAKAKKNGCGLIPLFVF